MSPKRPTPEELAAKRAERRAGRGGGNPGPDPETSPDGQEGTANPAPAPVGPVIAQGRAQPMLRLEELPEAIDAPDAQGPLSADEEERWELCRRGLAQYRDAWHVGAKAMDIALRGRLYRRDYATAEEFIRAEGKMSTSNAYRQIAGAAIAEILAETPLPALALGMAPSASESNGKSNDLSRMRDFSSVRDVPGIVITQRAADALGRVSKQFGPETAAKTYTTLLAVTGRETVPSKVVEGIVHQLPRGADLTEEQLLEQVRVIAVAHLETPADPLKEYAELVTVVSAFARRTRELGDVYERAVKADPAAAEKLTKRLLQHMASAGANFAVVADA